MRELVLKVWLPQCLTFGVSYELFWSLNPAKAEPFKIAFKQKKEEEREMMNYTAWLQGKYIREAVVSSFNENAKYPSKPHNLSGKQEELSNYVINQKMQAWAISVESDLNRNKQ